MYKTNVTISLLLTICTIIGCKIQHKFDKQAHRGGAGLTPENSIPGAINSVKNGWTNEMDLYISKDGQLVINHGSCIISIFSLYPDGRPVLKEDEKNLVLKDMLYSDIKKYDIGSKPHPTYPQQKKIATYIPRFADLIDSAENYAKIHHLKKPRYNIHSGPYYNLTDAYRKYFVDKIMDVLISKKVNKRAMIQAFDMGTIETVHRYYPGKIQIALLVFAKANLDSTLKKLTFKPDIYAPYFSDVTKEVVAKCHALKIKIIPWTIDEKQDIDRIKAMGVDGIISDYPNLL